MPVLKKWYIDSFEDIGKMELPKISLSLPVVRGKAYRYNQHCDGESVSLQLFAYADNSDSFVTKDGTHWILDLKDMAPEYKVSFPHVRKQLILNLKMLELIRNMIAKYQIQETE